MLFFCHSTHESNRHLQSPSVLNLSLCVYEEKTLKQRMDSKDNINIQIGYLKGTYDRFQFRFNSVPIKVDSRNLNDFNGSKKRPLVRILKVNGTLTIFIL